MTNTTVKLISNVKYNSKRYSRGEIVEILAKDLENFQTAGVIDDEYVHFETKPKSLTEMTLNELKDYATEKNIDLKGSTKKDDIITIIQAADGDSNDNE